MDDLTSTRTFGDEIVDSFADAGVGAVFFNSGSDIMFYQESIARRQAQAHVAPQLVTMPHELLCLSAALGYTAVSGTPAVTAVHVDVGTLNYGAGLHTAARAHLPVILTAGMPATADPGTLRGARDGGHFCTQQIPDQNGIVRQYVKWDHQLRYQDNPWNVAGRAVEVATAPPCGPVYLSIPREISMLPSAGLHPRKLPFEQRGVTAVGAPPVAIIDSTINALLGALRVIAIVGDGGRNPAAAVAFTRFIEQFGVAVVNGCPPTSSYQNLPMDHPQYLMSGGARGADVVLVFECAVPWLPGRDDPSEDAQVFFIGLDPSSTHLTLLDTRASSRIMSDTETFCRALLEAYPKLSQQQRDALAGRSAAIRDEVAIRRKTAREQALARRSDDFIDSDWAALTVAESLPADSIVLDDTVMSAPVHRYLKLKGPGQYFHHPSTAGSWGPGAAFGAALAAKGRPVILVTGDGFYMYGAPTGALWSGRAHKAPFLAIIFQNDSYNTGTEETVKFYPGGFAQRSGLAGGYFPQPIDFAAEAQSAGAYGENVRHADELGLAIARGLTEISGGRCAVIAIQLPRLLEHPGGS